MNIYTRKWQEIYRIRNKSFDDFNLTTQDQLLVPRESFIRSWLTDSMEPAGPCAVDRRRKPIDFL